MRPSGFRADRLTVFAQDGGTSAGRLKQAEHHSDGCGFP